MEQIEKNKTDKTIFERDGRLTLIAGPCVMESEQMSLEIAEEVKKITERLGIHYYFKASFDKANRTSADHFRGPGVDEGIRILKEVKKRCQVRIVTDIHEPFQAERVAEVADIIQIPAFLCRQTDLLKAAAETGRIVNVKKAQFLSPEEMGRVVGKLEHFGCYQILLTERGTMFGYNNQVVDMTGIIRMKQYGYPIIIDATHSTQISGGGPGLSNSGKREFVPCIAKAAIAAGADAVFMEVHPEPQEALCDASCMWPLSKLELLLSELKQLYDLTKTFFL